MSYPVVPMISGIGPGWFDLPSIQLPGAIDCIIAYNYW